MKKIGIIGGIGPESTIEYYRLMIQSFRDRLNSKNYPEVIINSIDMTQMLDYVFTDQLDELVRFLKLKVEALEKIGVDYVALAFNTPHLVFDALAKSVNVKMISIVEATCDAIKKSGMTKVGLLGTKSTMSKGFYQAKGSQFGIDIIVPDDQDQDYVHEKYMGELVFNQIEKSTKSRLIQIVEKLREKENITGIVLAGTELPLILSQNDFENFKVFNTTEIHVNAILDKMIQE